MNIHIYEEEIKKLNDQLALGYEKTLDFNYGYIYALFKHKLISRKEKSILMKVYSNYDDEEYYIGTDGELRKFDE